MNIIVLVKHMQPFWIFQYSRPAIFFFSGTHPRTRISEPIYNVAEIHFAERKSHEKDPCAQQNKKMRKSQEWYAVLSGKFNRNRALSSGTICRIHVFALLYSQGSRCPLGGLHPQEQFRRFWETPLIYRRTMRWLRPASIPIRTIF